MKLNADQIDAVKHQTNIDPLPEGNADVDQLKSHFGDHTFYLDMNGLHVLEPVKDADVEGEPAAVVKIAHWTDEEKTALAPQSPEVTGSVVKLSVDGASE